MRLTRNTAIGGILLVTVVCSAWFSVRQFNKGNLEWTNLSLSPEELRLEKHNQGTYYFSWKPLKNNHVVYLVKLAEDDLGYGNIMDYGKEDAILMVAHITEHITRYDAIGQLSSNPFRIPGKATIINEAKKYLDKKLQKLDDTSLIRMSQKQQRKMDDITPGDIVDFHRTTGKPFAATCRVNTELFMAIFDSFKRFGVEGLAPLHFIPMYCDLINHLWQGIYDAEKKRLAQICVTTDDVDEKFNSGEKVLDWAVVMQSRAELFFPGHFDFEKGFELLLTKHYEQSIDYFRKVEKMNDLISPKAVFYIGQAYENMQDLDDALVAYERLHRKYFFSKYAELKRHEVIRERLRSRVGPLRSP